MKIWQASDAQNDPSPTVLEVMDKSLSMQNDGMAFGEWQNTPLTSLCKDTCTTSVIGIKTQFGSYQSKQIKISFRSTLPYQYMVSLKRDNISFPSCGETSSIWHLKHSDFQRVWHEQGGGSLTYKERMNDVWIFWLLLLLVLVCVCLFNMTFPKRYKDSRYTSIPGCPWNELRFLRA